MANPHRFLAAAYLDMVGYSHMICQDAIGVVGQLRFLRSMLIGPSIKRHHGVLVNTGGDSWLVVFADSAEATRFAIEVQQSIQAYNLFKHEHSRRHQIQLRIGVDIGETIDDGSDLHGICVVTAVRLQTICPPGGICISRTIEEGIRGRLEERFEWYGSFNLKNIVGQTDAYVFVPDSPTGRVETA
jgi:adenylate cyclase